MKPYETTFIIDAHLPTEKVDATAEKLINFIEKGGGKILHTDRWGKRRLAYEIDKKQYGYYVYVRFNAEPAFLKELDKMYKLDETILRHLTTVVPPSVVKEESNPEQLRAKTKPDAEATEDHARTAAPVESSRQEANSDSAAR